MRRVYFSTLAMALSCITCASAQSKPPVFPMSKGTTWVYSARVRWDDGKTNGGAAKSLRWTSTVIDSYAKDDVAAALLHGGPWDLAWYAPQDTKPDDYLVIRAADAYFLVPDNAAARFAELKNETGAEVSKRFANDIWFRVPIKADDTYCAPGQESTAPMYCWAVDEVTTTRSLRIAGFTGKSATEYSLAFRTNPDSTSVRLVPGVGVVAYEYEHHGTISEAAVKLVEYHVGDQKPR